jgi:DNA polymerase-3 subunit gamma/tau
MPMSDAPEAGGPSEGLGMLFAAEDAPKREQAAAPYRVLARKYRPSSFEDLIGQEAMVKTLSNAFDLDRIHQAYMLTGVRGVGKTTTARILARAFNYEVPAHDGHPAVTRPTIHMPEIGVHCQAIIESRHVDVIEMDAASHTGIDDVREIIENARYRPVMARTKVYIIDEVHMLSKQAFNGLLKTLEEPPDHVKFLFATTEIEKVPVTVRSRCQRFDLRRVEAPVLAAHLARICAKEHVPVEDEALAVIARAAEGSVRDALSLLDQAMAQGAGAGGALDGASLRAMLGLADRTRIIDLFEEVMRGDMAAALRTLKDLHDGGGEPGQILVDLADFVHFVTRLKLVPEAGDDPAATPDERTRGKIFAKTLSMAVLTRAWQLLLKGLGEVKDSPRPLAAADMVLVRLAYAADLPPPGDVLRQLSGQGASGSGGGLGRGAARAASNAPNAEHRGAADRGGREARARCRDPARPSRGHHRALCGKARHSAQNRARARRASRAFRGRLDRILGRARRFAAIGADADAQAAGMDRRALDDHLVAPSRGPQFEAAGRRARKADDFECRKRSVGAKRARPVSRRESRRGPPARRGAAAGD